MLSLILTRQRRCAFVHDFAAMMNAFVPSSFEVATKDFVPEGVRLIGACPAGNLSWL